jgi:DNA-binding winged helix-turn-helix (wHTH) protein/TolB-like protein
MLNGVNAEARFGLFAFDPESGALTRGGVPVRLQPQPARVLAILVDRPGEVVSREALRQQVWSDGTFVDFERGLNFCIAQIRSALGDSADSPRFIETLPRRGYRFIAPVTRITEEAPEAGKVLPCRDVEPQPVSSVFSRRGSWASPIALLGLGIVTAVLVGQAWRSSPADQPIRIAVVPFDNETGLDSYDQIARGVADATVARLSAPDRVQRFRVIGNAAALHQPRAFRDLKRIGLELDADYIVLAQMKRDDAQVRLIGHLIRVTDESHVWAHTYDRPAFPLDVQSEIAEAIAAAVVRTLENPSLPPR